MFYATVAQLVEQRPEEPCVVGPSPTCGISAEVAQLIERILAKDKVAGLNPVFRLFILGCGEMASRQVLVLKFGVRIPASQCFIIFITMINILMNNPWVIGIGGTVIAGLILYYGFGIGKDRSKDNKIQHQNQIENNGSITTNKEKFKKFTLSKKSPRDIINDIDNHPLSAQKIIASGYIDYKITWEVKLFSLNDDTFDNDRSNVFTVSLDKFSCYVCFSVQKNMYNFLNRMNRYDHLMVRGIIEKVSGSTIYLKNCIIKTID